jgi:hypothetical protein
VRWDSPDVARLIEKRLQPLDETRARALKYELLWNYDRLDEATALYEQYKEWPELVHTRQSRVYAVLDRYDAAQRTAARVRDERERRAVLAYMMFRKKDWRTLQSLRPLSDAERRLHLLGVAQHDVRTAGKSLLRMNSSIENDLPVLRVLVRYYGALGDDAAMQAHARMLTAAAKKETARLMRNAERAVEEKNAAYLRTLIGQVERVAEDAPELARLREQYENLVREPAPSAQIPGSKSKS